MRNPTSADIRAFSFVRFIRLVSLLSLAALPLAPAAAGFNYWDPADTTKTPKTLSATGAYTDIRAGKLIAQAHPFEVNSPLWSDGAHKKRWVLLKPGKSIAFSVTDDYWGYPDSAVFIKQFAIDTVPGDTLTRRLWETRLLINKREVWDEATGAVADHWYGFSYKWNAAGTDANLVGFQNVNDSMRIFPQGRGKPSAMKKWTFPAENCQNCHQSRQNSLHSRSVLGFLTPQLNRPPAGATSGNQLENLFAKGVLTGSKPASWDQAPRWRAIDDAGASINVRARSYLAANCSGCHGTRGNDNGAADFCHINFDYQNLNDTLFEFRHRYSRGFGMEEKLPRFYPNTDKGNNPLGRDSLEILPALIVPGFPQKSAIVARNWARNTTPGDYDRVVDQMPPYGSFEVNEPAMAVVEQWIRELPAKPAPGWDEVTSLSDHGRSVDAPRLRGRTLLLPESRLSERVSMTGLDGRALRLIPQSRGSYAIPSDAPRGLYLIRVGSQTFRHYLL